MAAAGSIREMSSEMVDTHGNFDLFRLVSSVRIKTGICTKSHKIEYVPMHTIPVITGFAWNYRRTDRTSASISCEHCRSSRNNSHYAPRHIIYYCSFCKKPDYATEKCFHLSESHEAVLNKHQNFLYSNQKDIIISMVKEVVIIILQETITIIFQITIF